MTVLPSAVTVKALAGGRRPARPSSASWNARFTEMPRSDTRVPLSSGTNLGAVVSAVLKAVALATFDAAAGEVPEIAETR